jgi:acyl-CoA thioesterase FadM
MATAIRNENRPLDSEPRYLFATGSMNITYLKPTPVDATIRLEAQVKQIKNERKYTLHCDVMVDDSKTAQADVVALLVYRSDRPDEAPEVFRNA